MMINLFLWIYIISFLVCFILLSRETFSSKNKRIEMLEIVILVLVSITPVVNIMVTFSAICHLITDKTFKNPFYKDQ